jgi:nitroreductase
MDPAVPTSLFEMLNLILGRRSRREGFLAEPVPTAVIEQVVACGLAAPSSKNAQPWRIHVVTNRNALQAIAGDVDCGKGPDQYVPIDPATGENRPDWDSTVSESAQVLREVPLGLFVENGGRFSNGRHTVATSRDDIREDALIGYGLEMVGLGAAIQNMWLAAESLGLSGVFMGDVLIAEDAIRERLGMRGDLVGVLALGFSGMKPYPKQMADDRVVHHPD